jgi:hypothetical protein
MLGTISESQDRATVVNAAVPPTEEASRPTNVRCTPRMYPHGAPCLYVNLSDLARQARRIVVRYRELGAALSVATLEQGSLDE